MLYSKMINKALIMSFNAHKDQVDKSGIPYVYHPFHVAEQMDDEDSVIVALLHDVVEDSNVTEEDLRDAGFKDEIIEAIILLTHKKNVPYLEYVEHLKHNKLARKIKKADLMHNSDMSRNEVVDKKTAKRMRKYKKALKILDEAEANEC